MGRHAIGSTLGLCLILPFGHDAHQTRMLRIMLMFEGGWLFLWEMNICLLWLFLMLLTTTLHNKLAGAASAWIATAATSTPSVAPSTAAAAAAATGRTAGIAMPTGSQARIAAGTAAAAGGGANPCAHDYCRSLALLLLLLVAAASSRSLVLCHQMSFLGGRLLLFLLLATGRMF